MNDDRSELFPIVDECGRVLGSITRGAAHGGSRMLHPVVHLHLFNSKGELYLQRRPQWKDIQPGKWDTATGGHVSYGESVEDALRREVSEELGITDFTPVGMGCYVFDSGVERELVYVHQAVYDGIVCPNAEELDGGRFWTADEIKASMGRGVFTPNFEHEYNIYFASSMSPSM